MTKSNSPLDLDNLADLPVEEIQKMMKKMQSFVDKRMEAKKKEALTKIQNLVAEYELSYDDVMAVIRTTAKRGKAPPIYRNPENPRQTWSGKGDAPEWYTNHKDPESLRIPNT